MHEMGSCAPAERQHLCGHVSTSYRAGRLSAIGDHRYDILVTHDELFLAVELKVRAACLPTGTRWPFFASGQITTRHP
jgi:hypothetical protein